MSSSFFVFVDCHIQEISAEMCHVLSHVQLGLLRQCHMYHVDHADHIWFNLLLKLSSALKIEKIIEVSLIDFKIEGLNRQNSLRLCK